MRNCNVALSTLAALQQMQPLVSQKGQLLVVVGVEASHLLKFLRLEACHRQALVETLEMRLPPPRLRIGRSAETWPP